MSIRYSYYYQFTPYKYHSTIYYIAILTIAILT